MSYLGLRQTWISEDGLEGSSVSELYILCLQWSLAQSGVSGFNRLSPANGAELVFSCVVSMLWISILAVGISCITQWSLKLRDGQRHSQRTEARVRKYLQENKISAGVGNSMVRFARTHASRLMVKLTDDDIPIFKDMPLSLRVQIHRQIHGPILRTHIVLSTVGDTLLDSICHLACSNGHYLAGQQVFQRGDEAKHVIFVRSGELSYYARWRREPWILKAGTWVSEVALWRSWTHVGWLLARTTNEVTSIDVARFNDIMAESAYHGDDMSVIRAYARLMTSYFEVLGAVTDVWAHDGFIGALAEKTLAEMSDDRELRSSGRSNGVQKQASLLSKLTRTNAGE
jgi:CRP-like cAMP-binding protein